VNLLDVVLVLLAISAVSVGYRMGLLARTAGWIGFLAGLGLATVTVPLVLGRVDGRPGATRLVLALVVLGLTVSVVSGIAGAVGRRLRAAVADTVLGGPDRVAGAAGGLAVLVATTWLLAPAAADIPGGIARQVRGSTVAATVLGSLPPPPPVADTLADAISLVPFPDVLGPLQPAPDLGSPPADLPLATDVLARVTRSTVNVEGRGCGLLLGEGSGWVVEPGVVVTNAHVVEQLVDVSVRRDDGSVRPATVVAIDQGRDLALLSVDGMRRPPLPRATAVVGEEAVVAGHPDGQDQVRVAPARVERVQSTIGRTTDGRVADRQVVFLAAELRPGDSGSPVANVDGAIIATAFAIAPDARTTAYAISDLELDAVLDAPRAPWEAPACN